jgi:hypothetical protein
VQDLVSPCLRPRHWHALSRAVHTKNSLYLGYNKLVQMQLRDIMKLNLHEHLTIVRQVGGNGSLELCCGPGESRPRTPPPFPTLPVLTWLLLRLLPSDSGLCGG